MHSGHIFAVIVSVIVILLLVQWCISVVKYLIMPNWEKIKEVTLGILGGIGVLIGFIFMVWFFSMTVLVVRATMILTMFIMKDISVYGMD